MADDVNDLYDRFVREWYSGAAPDVEAFLARLEGEDVETLAGQLETFLLVAPAVEPRRESVSEDDPVLAAAIALGDAFDERPWARRFADARRSAGLSLSDVGARLADAFGLTGHGPRAATLLGRLESGELASSGVSARAARALARILGQAEGALIPPRAAALYRADSAEGAELESLLAGASAALSLQDGEQWDELDDLLRGG
ncbi:MAG: hypothetical protein ITG02_00925 [Patulibacter sp.]|nr:hypothetical protein [Patulibacter sp.]